MRQLDGQLRQFVFGDRSISALVSTCRVRLASSSTSLHSRLGTNRNSRRIGDGADLSVDVLRCLRFLELIHLESKLLIGGAEAIVLPAELLAAAS